MSSRSPHGGAGFADNQRRELHRAGEGSAGHMTAAARVATKTVNVKSYLNILKVTNSNGMTTSFQNYIAKRHSLPEFNFKVDVRYE